LEFKSEVPDKKEMLKKLSSFANTFGGIVVIGAKGDSTGRLVELPGVVPQNSFKQQVVQWCFDGASPPLTVEVSDPIPHATEGGRVFYVIYVSESEVAPHFLNGRKGVWVRADEFSQRTDPQLADEGEIRHLLEGLLVNCRGRRPTLRAALGGSGSRR
jgi:predicted HTH transcriptional regulator